MKQIEIKARAKINLTLDVLGKRPDGYHEVEMVMQTIELYDGIIIEEVQKGIQVTTDHPLLKSGNSNIAFKAASLLVEKYAVNKGLKIHINKNIPVAAGLAGGSTDAAAVLKGINRLWDIGLSNEELAGLALTIGSDVPFCITGGTALAKGRGEILTVLPGNFDIWLVLAKPDLEVSTAEVYNNYKSELVSSRPDTQAMVGAVGAGDVGGITGNLANVLESVTLRLYPVVLELKRAMEQSGVCKALMSGSGPTVFGFVDSFDNAVVVAERLKKMYPAYFVEVSRTWAAGQQEFKETK